MVITRTTSSPYKFESNSNYAQFPFEMARTGSFFQTRVGESEPLWFLIDSGAGASYIDNDVARRIGLKTQGKRWVQGAGTGKVEVDAYQGVEFRLPGLRSSDHTVNGINFSGVSKQWGRPLHGLFEHDFLARFTVTINYPKRKIRIEEPGQFSYAGPGAPIPLEFNGPLPYVKATIHVHGNPPVEGSFLVDTGSQDEVDHPLIAKSTAGTEPTTGGVGFGTPYQARLGKVELLELGPIRIHGATGIATEAGLGSRLIGGGVLSRFMVIFDYQRGRMILEEASRS